MGLLAGLAVLKALEEALEEEEAKDEDLEPPARELARLPPTELRGDTPVHGEEERRLE